MQTFIVIFVVLIVAAIIWINIQTNYDVDRKDAILNIIPSEIKEQNCIYFSINIKLVKCTIFPHALCLRRQFGSL